MDNGCSLPVGCLHSFKAVHTMCFAMKHIVGFYGLYFFLQRLRPLSTTVSLWSCLLGTRIVEIWVVMLPNLHVYQDPKFSKSVIGCDFGCCNWIFAAVGKRNSLDGLQAYGCRWGVEPYSPSFYHLQLPAPSTCTFCHSKQPALSSRSYTSNQTRS